MIDYKKQYNSPVPQGFYYAKLLEVELQKVAGASRPKILARLKIIPLEQQGPAKHVELYALIHETTKADIVHSAFCKAFRIQLKDCSDGVGHIASIGVRDAMYNGQKYSSIYFVEQSPMAKASTKNLEYQDDNGQIPWDE